MIGIGVVILVVITSIFIIYFANKADEQDKIAQQFDQLNKFNDRSEPEVTGGSTDKYSWDQNHEAVDVNIPLNQFDPSPAVKDIDVSITPRYLKVSIRKEVYLEGYFSEKVNADDCCWTLDREVDNTVLCLSLIKAKPSEDDLWPCLLDGEPPINLPRRRMPSVETLDPSDPTAMQRARKALKR